MRRLTLKLIRVYQHYISWVFGPQVCRYQPHCSEYFYQATAKYGILHGGYLGLKRVLRCHPGNVGGYDPVP